MSKLYARYTELKKKDPNCIYFFKVGIFYLALAEDAIKLSEPLKLNLGNLNDNIVKIVPMSEKNAKLAETIYNVLEIQKNYAFVKVNILTGRSHQIRVQMANIGAPLFGDGKYGKQTKTTKHLALWAGELTFKHPTKDETLHFKVYPPEEKPWTEFNIQKFLN